MATLLESPVLNVEAVRELSRSRREPEFLLERRLKALDAWQKLPMPGRKDELWRRVRLDGLDLDAVLATPRTGNYAKFDPNAKAPTGSFWGPLEGAQGVHLEALKQNFATQAYPAGELGDLKARRGGKFHALNQALFDNGYLLHVPAGQKSTEPLSVTFETRPGKGAIFPHNVIVLEDGAEAVVIEKYVSGDPNWTGLSCPQTEAILGKGSKLHYILLQHTGFHGTHIGAHRLKLAEGAHANFPSAHLGAATSKSFLEAEMQGTGAHVVIYGLYYGLEEQHIHLDTWQHHIAPGCVSDLMFKGALDQKAQAVYRGMIRLEPGAQKTDAYQQNRTLLLSDEASAHSIPGLEILANDVRCTHGATAGQMDPTMLFYLLSRGLTRFEARKMILDGFFEEVVVKFGLEAVTGPLRFEVDKKIEGKQSHV